MVIVSLRIDAGKGKRILKRMGGLGRGVVDRGDLSVV